MESGIDNLEIRKFLLGSADDGIVEEIGVRLVADDEFSEQVSLVEESIIEDFLAGDLDETETRLFRENFMTSPARERLLGEISAVRVAAASLADVHDSEPAAVRARPKLIPSWAFAVLLLFVIAGAFLVWRFAGSESMSPREVEFAAINSGDVTAEASRRGIPATVLVPGSLRGVATAGRAKAGSELFLNFALPADAVEIRYDLEIRRGDKTVFRQRSLPVIRNSAGGEIRALVPPLEKGEYRITLGRDIAYDLFVE